MELGVSVAVVNRKIMPPDSKDSKDKSFKHQ